MLPLSHSRALGNESKPRIGYYSSDAGSAVKASRELAESPIIASVISPEVFEAALSAPTRTLYLLIGNPITLPGYLRLISERDKLGIVNMDFLEGLTRDRSAVAFLAAHGAAGVVSTRAETLRAAQAMGLKTVQRCFAIDHAAVKALRKSLSTFCPDAVEVLPAMVAPRVGRQIREGNPNITIVGGGLLESVKEIEQLVLEGVNAVSTSNPQLWLV